MRVPFIDHLTQRARDLERSRRPYAAWVLDPDGNNVEAVVHER